MQYLYTTGNYMDKLTFESIGGVEVDSGLTIDGDLRSPCIRRRGLGIILWDRDLKHLKMSPTKGDFVCRLPRKLFSLSLV
jgi:hypothetical protein